MKPYLLIVSALGSVVVATALSARPVTNDNGSNLATKDFTSDLGLNGNIPTGVGFHIPGVYLSKVDEGKAIGLLPGIDDPKVYISVGGKQIYQHFSESNASGARGEVKVNAGINFSSLSVEGQLNLEKLITEAENSKIKDNGSVITNGLTSANTKTLLEKLYVTVHALQIGTKDGKPLMILSVMAGRDAVTPLASFVMEEAVGMSILRGAALDQTEQIKVSVDALDAVIIDFAMFGDTWLPYPGDDDNGDRFANVKDQNDKLRNYAVNVRSKPIGVFGGNLEAYLSWASLDDFVNINNPTLAPQSGNQIAGGAKWTGGKVRVAAEVYHKDPKEGSRDPKETGISASAGYQLTQRLMPYIRFENVMSDNSAAEGRIYSVGAKYNVAENAAISVEYSRVDKETGTDENVFGVSVTLTGGADKAKMLNERLNTPSQTEPAAH